MAEILWLDERVCCPVNDLFVLAGQSAQFLLKTACQSCHIIVYYLRSYTCLWGIFCVCNAVIINKEHTNSCLLKILALLFDLAALIQNTSLWHASVNTCFEHPWCFLIASSLEFFGWPIPSLRLSDVRAQQTAPYTYRYLLCGFCLGCWCACLVSRSLDVYVSHSKSSSGLYYIHYKCVLGCSMLRRPKQHRRKKGKIQEL